jgi:transcriptional regulator with XRE-family HTH domain
MVLKQAERHQLYYTYVEIMRDCREVNELSQSSLAREVGLSSKYVTLVEGGKRTPSLESLLALMAASQVKRKTAENLVKEILGRFDWRT